MYFMAKNERILAQDLAEIKHAMQTNDLAKINELRKILVKEIQKYPVKPDIMDRLEKVSNYPRLTDVSSDEQVKEIEILIEILISSR